MKATIELNEESFQREALQSEHPVVVDFWAEWCGPCKMLGPVLEEIAREEQGRAIVGKVNIDDHPELANRYRVESIPTLLYFRDGEVRDRTVGVVSKKTIVTKIESLRTKLADHPPA